MVEDQLSRADVVMVRYPLLYTSEGQVRSLAQRLEEFVRQLSVIDGWEIEPAFSLPSQWIRSHGEGSVV